MCERSLGKIVGDYKIGRKFSLGWNRVEGMGNFGWIGRDGDGLVKSCIFILKLEGIWIENGRWLRVIF